MRSSRTIYAALAVLAMGIVATLLLVLIVFMGSINRINGAQLHGCEMANITRALDNSAHLSNYNFYNQQINFTQSTLQSNYDALQKVGISKTVLNTALKNTEATLSLEKNEASTMTWATLTNCTAGPNEGIEVYTIASNKPPANQLSLTNATLPDPAGSVP